jgi:hypothetical protein
LPNSKKEQPTLSEIRDKVEQVIAATVFSFTAAGQWVNDGGREARSSRHLIPEVRKLGIDISYLFDSQNLSSREGFARRVEEIRERARALGVIE